MIAQRVAHRTSLVVQAARELRRISVDVRDYCLLQFLDRIDRR